MSHYKRGKNMRAKRKRRNRTDIRVYMINTLLLIIFCSGAVQCTNDGFKELERNSYENYLTE